MVDQQILKDSNVTVASLRDIFTTTEKHPDGISEEEREEHAKKWKTRDRIQKRIAARLEKAVADNLESARLFMAVDAAYDGPPILKRAIPLMRWAQGRLNSDQAASFIRACGHDPTPWTVTTKSGETEVDLPRFAESEFNLVRSVVNRKVAAISGQYASLTPYYKYGSRSTSVVARLRSDAFSSYVDSMASAWDYKTHESEIIRNMLLYTTVIDFVRSPWEEESVYMMRNGRKERIVTREGLDWVAPHPTRTYWDDAFPLSDLNKDAGMRYVGYWDIMRLGDLKGNPRFYNTGNIGASDDFIGYLTKYSYYFDQYCCAITVPVKRQIDPNDRVSNRWYYDDNEEDASVLLAVHHEKLNPLHEGIGDYDGEVWVRFFVAGADTIVYAEPLPSSPAANFSFNRRDDRRHSISMAHELLTAQDVITALFTMMYDVIKQRNFKVFFANTDILDTEHNQGAGEQEDKGARTGEDKSELERVVDHLKGRTWYTNPLVVPYSAERFRELGINKEDIVSMVESHDRGGVVSEILQAIATVIRMSERLLSMSSNELGQPVTSGETVTATESAALNQSSSAMNRAISDAVDAGRAAKKRIIYESFMAHGRERVNVALLSRYPLAVLEQAGFNPMVEEMVGLVSSDSVEGVLVTTDKLKLAYDYVYTSRDGSERQVNVQAANMLIQLLGILQNPLFLQQVPSGKLFEMLNAIARYLDSGVDLNIPPPDDPEAPLIDRDQILEETLKAIQQQVVQNTQQLAQLTGVVETI